MTFGILILQCVYPVSQCISQKSEIIIASYLKISDIHKVSLKNIKIHEHEAPDKFYYHSDGNNLTTENACKYFYAIKI